MAETTTLPTIWRVPDELWAHIHALINQYDHRIGEEKKDGKGEKTPLARRVHQKSGRSGKRLRRKVTMPRCSSKEA